LFLLLKELIFFYFKLIFIFNSSNILISKIFFKKQYYFNIFLNKKYFKKQNILSQNLRHVNQENKRIICTQTSSAVFFGFEKRWMD